MKRIDLSVYEERLSNLELAVVTGASIALIAGFLPWWGEKVGLFGSLSVNGWSAGFTARAGLLLLAVAGLLVVVRASVSWFATISGPWFLIAAVSAIGLLLVFIRWLSLRRHAGNGLDYGASYGIYVALIAGIVEVAAAVVALRGSSEPLLRPRPNHTDPRR